jgi:hypothetical protein
MSPPPSELRKQNRIPMPASTRITPAPEIYPLGGDCSGDDGEDDATRCCGSNCGFVLSRRCLIGRSGRLVYLPGLTARSCSGFSRLNCIQKSNHHESRVHFSSPSASGAIRKPAVMPNRSRNVCIIESRGAKAGDRIDQSFWIYTRTDIAGEGGLMLSVSNIMSIRQR